MLRIGYVRLRDARSADDTAILKDFGCHVVRAEEPVEPGNDEQAVLYSILPVLGRGAHLDVARLDPQGPSPRHPPRATAARPALPPGTDNR
ncbi:MAG TPA: hypothetical protein PKA17_01040, partial [Phenylobacterium sp.]|nr:hypothetical protein [Phenylobacterium sp.]